jgi:transcriptional regulator with XRE-family HTH domain
VPTKQRPVDRGVARGRDLIATLGRDLRLARRGHGLSLESVAVACGLSTATVSRIERGLVTNVSILDLSRLLAVSGLELSARAYPNGEPIRDRAQLELLARFRAQLHPAIRFATEVPLPIHGDLRTWDALIAGADWRFGVEVESGPDDAQALARRMRLKERDGDVDGVVLVVPATRRARQFLRLGRATLEPIFPASGAATLELLRAGRRPTANSIVVV